jgi:rare lipoprotein A
MGRLLLVLLLLALSACASKKPTEPSAGAIGAYKVGKPYEVQGVWYYPKIDWEYRETGIASWYGPGFHGKRTANGEVFNENDLTAAHPTLPMPVMVQVTNLENGRSIKVRVNDRGPFANNRVIDLSRRSAQLLDIERAGTARVLVEILPQESAQLIAIAQGKTPDDLDMPQAAPVTNVEAKPLGGAVPASPTAPGQPAPLPQPTATQTAAQPPAPLPWPTEEVQQVQVQPTELYIQAGSFTHAGNAAALAQRLAAFGNAFVAAARVGTQDFYRVRVGPLASLSEADGTLSRMVAAGYSESHIVVE